LAQIISEGYRERNILNFFEPFRSFANLLVLEIFVNFFNLS